MNRFLLLIINFLFFATIVNSQNFHKDPRWFSPNGPVNKIVIDSNTNQVFVGGDFDYVGPSNGYLFLYDAKNNSLIDNIDQPNNVVKTNYKDDSLGWYIGGDFTSISGQKRGRIAHINGKGKLLPDFSNIYVNGYVSSMKKLGDSLYIAGRFTSVGQPSDYNLGANIFDSIGNNSNITFPQVEGKVNCSFKDNIGGLYIGGDFTAVGDSLRQNLAYIDSNGVVTSWNPFADKPVNAIQGKGDTIYIGGGFEYINKVRRNRLVAIQSGSGNILPWRPQLDGMVHSLLINGNKLYVGGDFAKVNDSTRKSFAEFTISDGLLTNLNLQVSSTNSSIRCMRIRNNTLYFGGYFDYVLGQSRQKLAAINLSSNTLLNWNPRVASFKHVYDLEIIDSTIYIAGSFQYVGNPNYIIRSKIAAIHATTGTILPFNVNIPSSVSSFVNDILIKGNNLYLVGRFTEIGTHKRSNFAAINRFNGTLLNWHPTTNNFFYEKNHITDYKNNILVFGEDIVFGGKRIEKLALIDLVSDTVVNWTPPAFDGNGEVFISQIDGYSDTLIISGSFNTLNNITRNNIAFIDKNTASILPINVNADKDVFSFEIDRSTLYLSGSFDTVGGLVRETLAAIDLRNGVVLPFDANIKDRNTTFYTKLIGDTLYVSGGFTLVGGQAIYSSLVALNKITGSVYNWYPNVGGQCNAMDSYADNFYIGGIFAKINLIDQMRCGKLDKDSAFSKPFFNASGTVLTISNSNGTILYGGEFKSVGGEVRKGFAAYDLTTGSLNPMTVNTEHYINDMELVDSNLYIAGNIFRAGNQNINDDIAVLNTSSGQINTSMFSGQGIATGDINDIEIIGNTLYIAGDYNTFNNQTRNGIASYDLNGDSLLPWNPNLPQFSNVKSILIKGDDLYLGGYFYSVQNQTRRGGAKVSRTTGILHNWDPYLPTEGPSVIVNTGSQLILGGLFNEVGPILYPYLAAVDDTLGILDTTFNYKPNGIVNSLVLRDSLLFIGGGFNSIGRELVFNKAIFNINTGKLAQSQPIIDNKQSFNLFENYKVNGMETNDKLLFVGTQNGLEVYNKDTLDFCVTEIVTNVNSCGNYFWSINNNTYSKSGIYSITKNSTISCDTLFKLNLTIDTISTKTTTTNNTITATSTNTNYQWLDCNNGFAIIPNAINQSFTPNVNGNFAVELTKQNCKDTSNCVNITSVSLSKISEELNFFRFYPNPTSGNIQFDSDKEVIKIEVFDTKQQAIETLQYLNNKLRIAHLPPGVYFLKVTFYDSQQGAYKLIKR